MTETHSSDSLIEANIDALVGPSHHFGGLGVGNVASLKNAEQVSHPRRAALEGIEKALLVAQLGVPQFLWLPPQRPRWDWLIQSGFSGSRDEQLRNASVRSPKAFSAAFSSAFMWAANSATVTPAVDALDNRYHWTPANLISSWHRGGEPVERMTDLRQWFASYSDCVVHDPLPSIVPLRDEGAANHMRLCDASGLNGVNLFVHGEDEANRLPSGFFPRHTRAASEAIARLHCLRPRTTFFLQQHPDVISAGAFHNDVIATSHQHLLLHHEFAFWEAEGQLEQLGDVFRSTAGVPLQRIQISNSELPLADAIKSYFFNSQIVSPAADQNGPRMVLVCPSQCETIISAKRLIDRLIADPEVPIDDVHFVRLRESMANGGGPACLRLRVPASQAMLAAIPGIYRVTPELVDRLRPVIEANYPEHLQPGDLVNLDFVESIQAATTAVMTVFQSHAAAT